MELAATARAPCRFQLREAPCRGAFDLGPRTTAAARAAMCYILAAAGAERICTSGDDAESSVVNGDLGAHEVDNLDVVGSSVFPTAGPAQSVAEHRGPLLTALSLRLARNLLSS